MQRDCRHGRSAAPDEAPDRPEPAAQLPPVQSARRSAPDRRGEEVRQAERRRARRQPERLGAGEPQGRRVAACCSWRGCGSRTSAPTISGAPRCASFRTRHRWARSPSAPTTPAWAGGTSSRRCTRTPPSREWYKEHGRHPVYANPRKAVPLPAGQPVTLKIPRDGQLVDYKPGPRRQIRRGRGRGARPQSLVTVNPASDGALGPSRPDRPRFCARAGGCARVVPITWARDPALGWGRRGVRQTCVAARLSPPAPRRRSR